VFEIHQKKKKALNYFKGDCLKCPIATFLIPQFEKNQIKANPTQLKEWIKVVV
jgi:hypothetical protein